MFWIYSSDLYQKNKMITIKGFWMDCLLISTFVMVCSSASIMGDACDWTGSGLTTSSSTRGVVPVYLRCNSGRVTWLYPRGALRILLKLPSPSSGSGEFRACVKLHHDGGKDVAAQVFLEGPRSLHPLYTNEHVGTKAVRCFHSKNGFAAMYVEDSNPDSVNKRVAEIEYDLEELPKGVGNYNPSEDCRPCTREELAHAFCTSDLVTRGIIRSVENYNDLQISQLNVKITKMIRHTADDDHGGDIETNSIVDSSPSSPGRTARNVKLNVPEHCGVSHGVGEFVFMAKRKLGDLVIKCAPRLEDWAMLMHQLTDDERSDCVLRS